jgi:hypothetical protein
VTGLLWVGFSWYRSSKCAWWERRVRLKDSDPFDYAKAERVFPESRTVKLSFKVLAKQASGRLDVDVRSQTPGGNRPVRIWFDGDGRIRLLDPSGRLIPGLSVDDCERIAEDSVDYPVRWKTGAGLRFQQGRKVP